MNKQPTIIPEKIIESKPYSSYKMKLEDKLEFKMRYNEYQDKKNDITRQLLNMNEKQIRFIYRHLIIGERITNPITDSVEIFKFLMNYVDSNEFSKINKIEKSVIQAYKLK